MILQDVEEMAELAAYVLFGTIQLNCPLGNACCEGDTKNAGTTLGANDVKNTHRGC